MSGWTGRDEKTKAFIARFDSLTGKYSRYQVWQDMIRAFAASICNVISGPHREKREQTYLDIIRKYDTEQQTTIAEMFGMLIEIMDESVTNGSFCDFLGDLFMRLELGNDAGGQFFTPFGICAMMAEIAYTDNVRERIRTDGFVTANDPACGAGATLIAFAEALHKNNVNYQQTCIFAGQDIDEVTALMCYVQLSLLGCAGYVHIGNTLTAPMTGDAMDGDGGEDTWYTPMYFTNAWVARRAIKKHRKILNLTGKAPAFPEIRKNIRETKGGQLAFDL